MLIIISKILLAGALVMFFSFFVGKPRGRTLSKKYNIEEEV